MAEKNYLKQEDYCDGIAAYIYREIILKYELELAEDSKGYAIRRLDKKFGDETLTTSIYKRTKENDDSKKQIEAAGKTPGNFIYCTNSKGNHVVSVFFHLRNCFAHGLVERIEIEGKTYLLLEDTYGQYTNMIAQINQDIFQELIERLVKTKESNPTKLKGKKKGKVPQEQLETT